jgi:hypothetical protein
LGGEANTVPEPYEAIFAAAMTIAVAIGFIAWLRIVFFGWKALANRRQEVHLFRDAPLGNPANILLKGDLLTERGLEYRRKMLAALLLFLVIVVGAFAIAAVIGVLAGLASR